MKSKILLVLISFLIHSGCSNSKTINGFWLGKMTMNGKSVDMSIDFNDGKNLLYSKDLMMMKLPLTNMVITNDEISFSYTAFDADILFKGKINGKEINGSGEIAGMPENMKIGFNLERMYDSVPKESYTVEDLTIERGQVKLSAEIYKPATKNLHPALVIVSGSEMDSPKNIYSFYADYFAKLGFEVLIFDKRGSGKSTGNSSTATYENLADDVVACLNVLRDRNTIDKNKIGLWGVSQGGMLSPYILSKTKILSFIISVAAEVNGPADASAYADSIRLLNRGYSFEEASIASQSHRIVKEKIVNGSSNKEVESFIRQNAWKHSFMNETGLWGNINITDEAFKGFYWQGRKYNFYSYWENVDIKTLVIYGEDDDLVDPIKNVTLIKGLNNKMITTKTFLQANHVIRKAFNPRKYPNFDWPRRVDEYFNFMNEWLKKENIL